jgi:16S rRNA (guanine527-N7)-methyltransferase
MEPRLADALAAHGIELGAEQTELLDRYRAALWRWNENINLTRHTTVEKFVGRDVVDSWQLAQHIGPSRRVLDLGSGGGVPGAILAILRPDLRVALCDSVQKKARVLQSLVEELALGVEVFGCRGEELLALRTFDVVVARGVAPLAKILGWLHPCRDAFEELLLVKGRSWIEERGEARHRGLLRGLELRKVAEYDMPLQDNEQPGQSVILSIRRRENGAEDRRPSNDPT